jgi:hypothetical protein
MGQIEDNESYFGARGKTIVFGLLERDHKVYTEITLDCKSITL